MMSNILSTTQSSPLVSIQSPQQWIRRMQARFTDVSSSIVWGRVLGKFGPRTRNTLANLTNPRLSACERLDATLPNAECPTPTRTTLCAVANFALFERAQEYFEQERWNLGLPRTFVNGAGCDLLQTLVYCVQDRDDARLLETLYREAKLHRTPGVFLDELRNGVAYYAPIFKVLASEAVSARGYIEHEIANFTAVKEHGDATRATQRALTVNVRPH